ncbi:putative spermidine/putrescine transport system permease protein [Rhodoligotrophos appendicifer]|uniref:ABC transporter permease n=1 Tax=Rhodoligotrophos appendicifer TaxID=987056 RepID=UPI00117E63C4|nr:ABC transporter permease [Rhodoligotrophos appendicifer]
MYEDHVRPRQRIPLYILGGIIMLLLIVPSMIVVPMSFSGSDFLEFPPREWSLRWYSTYFHSGTWLDATAISLTAAIFTALFATILGTLAAYGLRLLGRGLSPLLLAALTMPLTVPVILIAIGIFYVYARIGLVNTMTGLVLAHTMMAIPFVVVVVFSRLQSFDLNQVRVAESLGSNPARSFILIVLPQLRFSIISGALLAFLTSFDEVIIALFISGGSQSTLTRVMFTNLRDQVDPTIAAVASMLNVISVLLVVVFQMIEARDRRALSKSTS